MKAADVVKLKSASTLAGSELAIRVEGGQVRINESLVTKADVHASKGVIHVIDSVLLPPAE